MEPARSVTLCEAFLAGCHAKADELDDSSGSFGQFAQALICLWIKARQASGADPHETAASLPAWIGDEASRPTKPSPRDNSPIRTPAS